MNQKWKRRKVSGYQMFKVGNSPDNFRARVSNPPGRQKTRGEGDITKGFEIGQLVRLEPSPDKSRFGVDKNAVGPLVVTEVKEGSLVMKFLMTGEGVERRTED